MALGSGHCKHYVEIENGSLGVVGSNTNMASSCSHEIARRCIGRDFHVNPIKSEGFRFGVVRGNAHLEKLWLGLDLPDHQLPVIITHFECQSCLDAFAFTPGMPNGLYSDMVYPWVRSDPARYGCRL